MTTATTAFAAIDTTALDTVTGGVGPSVNANVNVNADINQGIRDVGTGLGRVIGCATGAESMREFGNCMLTGQLGNVPPSSSTPGAAAPAAGGQ